MELGPFTVLLVSACFFFSVQVFLMKEKRHELGETDNTFAYSDILQDQVSLLATGEYGVEIASTAGFLIYFFAFYFNVIVMLNLLIAIISERFGIILEQTIPMDCKEQCILMSEIERYAQIVMCKCSPPAEQDDEEQYLHLCRYKQDAGEEDDSNVDDEGRMRVMNNKLLKIKDLQERQVTSMDKLQEELEREITTKMFNVMRVLQHVQKKID